LQLHELDEMKRRLKEMEEEAAALREMQAKVAKEMQGWFLSLYVTCP
jgi:polyadenylate-binding protein 2